MSQTWRVSRLGRFGVIALAPLFGVLVWLLWGNVLVSFLAVLGALVGWWKFAWRPAVVLAGAEVIVRNPNVSRRIDIRDVVHVEPGYGGLTITTSTNERVVAWAVQKSNFAKWTGRHTRADDVATSIFRASRSGTEANSS